MRTFQLARYAARAVVAFTAFLTFMARGDLFVGSQTPNEILRYNGETGAFIGSSGSVGGDMLGMTLGPDGNLYACSGSVVRFDGKSGKPLGVFASGGGMEAPINLTFGPDGNLYVSCSYSQVLRYNGKTGAFIDAFISDNRLAYPRGLKFGPDGNLYIVSYNTSSVLRYNGTNGTFMDEFVPSRSGGLFTPSDLSFGPDGNLYVSGGTYPLPGVFRFNGSTGAFIDQFATVPAANQMAPTDFTFGPDANLYVVTQGSVFSVLRFNGNTGTFMDYFVPNASGGLGNPFGIAFSSGSTAQTNQPPIIGCPDAITVGFGSAASVNLSVSDADGDAITIVWSVNGVAIQTNTLSAGTSSNSTRVALSLEWPVGTNRVSVAVTDTASHTVSCSTTVTVLETPPPVILSVFADPASLWPPNHQFIDVSIIAQLEDTGIPTTWKIVSVSSNDSDQSSGNWVITGDHTLQLRAERSAGDSDRVYTVTIQATDQFGAISELKSVNVTVIHDPVPKRLRLLRALRPRK